MADQHNRERYTPEKRINEGEIMTEILETNERRERNGERRGGNTER